EKYCGPGDVLYAIPKRIAKNHKGDFGRLLVVGGSRNYVGTPTLVGWGASAVGCDIVNLCVPQYVADHMHTDPNLLVTPLKSSESLKESDVEDILNQRFDALALGNGLGRGKESKAALKKLLTQVDKPAILDADALTLVEVDWVGENMVVTPHSKEFKALFGVEVEGDISTLVEQQAKKYGCVVVLKGAEDIVSDGQITRFNKTGNAYMTKGGTGDVLAGAVGGLLAQNKDPYLSSCAGVFLTGYAGDLARDFYMESLTPQDVVESIPSAIKYCRDFL
ncbi:MAG: NAD(P)H-hydrate dehydratase, partial [Candidatus Altiarchaeales archaeon]|nr:NAD(P)H-hydrate dehydratase [Candidatus Altiarchaeales archaeon]